MYGLLGVGETVHMGRREVEDKRHLAEVFWGKASGRMHLDLREKAFPERGLMRTYSITLSCGHCASPQLVIFHAHHSRSSSPREGTSPSLFLSPYDKVASSLDLGFPHL